MGIEWYLFSLFHPSLNLMWFVILSLQKNLGEKINKLGSSYGEPKIEYDSKCG